MHHHQQAKHYSSAYSPSFSSSSSSSVLFPSLHLLRNVNLLIAFLLCPFIGTSSFLAPPLPLEMMAAANIDGSAEADEIRTTTSIKLLDGKLLLNLPQQNMQSSPPSSSSLLTSSGAEDEGEEEQVCAKSSHRNATLVHSISKSTGGIVHLYSDSNFDVVFCGGNSVEGAECAIGANCASVYRWAHAMVRHSPSHPRTLHRPNGPFVHDLVLVPVDCLCVLGWEENFGIYKEPVILE